MVENFWNSLAAYNVATWWLQILLVLVGMALTVRLYRKPSKRIKQAMKAYMIILYSWIAVVYYYIFAQSHPNNLILAIFWGILAVMWLFDLLTDYTPLERTEKYSRLSYIMLAIPFIYPLFSIARGQTYPHITFLVMPCSVAVFTIGILLSHARRTNLWLILCLCHWALIGVTKTVIYHLPEDFLLVSSLVPAIYLYAKEYFFRERNDRAWSNYRFWTLVSLCVIIGMTFYAVYLK